MTTTRATIAEVRKQRQERQRRDRAGLRRKELVLLLLSSLFIAGGLFAVYKAKTHDLESFDAQVKDGKLLLLEKSPQPQQILPYLEIIESAAERQYAAERISRALSTEGQLANAGALAKIRVSGSEVASERNLDALNKRMAEAKKRRETREEERESKVSLLGRSLQNLKNRFWPPPEREVTIPLLTSAQLAFIKPTVAARTPLEFRNALILWAAVYMVAIYCVHLFWRVRRFGGDNVIFPIMHLLSGVGLILMISLRDPVRDTLMFRDFAQGAAIGCAALMAFSLINYERQASGYAYIWLAMSVALAGSLYIFGSGPGASDAKVNLLGVQPMEAIRILLVLFIAGYFGQNWDAIRELRQQRGGPLAKLAGVLHIARFDYTLPVFVGVAAALVLFFLLRDMGPALLLGCLLIGLYSIARNSFRLGAVGLLIIVAGFWTGHAAGIPETVSQRVDMWLSRWDNTVHGGDQIAHSLWSFATGAATGTGVGLGNPEVVPAGHTDLIIAVVGEQMGFIGVLCLYAIYAVLIWRCLRIALRAPGAYSFFLVAGLTLITALQLILISGGILGLIPLSGVVSPFLSFGRSSMIANFAIFGIILAVSAQSGSNQKQPFARATRFLGVLLGTATLAIAGAAAYYQVVKQDETLIRGSLVVNADGVRRYEYNPRLVQIAHQLPRGDIFDRNGIPLATSDYAKIQSNQKQYESLGISTVETTSKLDRRHYPLGAPLFYLLGDLRTRLKRGASNTAFIEMNSHLRLQGYEDYHELVPLLRHRYEPENPAVREILDRPRDVRMSIDARLQMKASEILKRGLTRLKHERGAIVVLDPASGDLLAAVSYPWPAQSQLRILNASEDVRVPSQDLMDRARYGLFPPGSSFKIVTAIAALRTDPALANRHFECVRLPDGRTGNFVGKSRRPIRDDVMDRNPHGSVDLNRGIIVSCNAYFAQLGFFGVGAKNLFDTANQLDIAVARPDTAEQLAKNLAQASYGQGQVVVSPFQMARVAATIANHGAMPMGRWIIDESNPRTTPPKRVLAPELADRIAASMRGVVLSGTGRRAGNAAVPIAGKTGTAELQDAPSHAWFIGFAPYNGEDGKEIAFAVLVENGQYGGTAAAPIAAEVVTAAHELGLI